LARSHFSYEKRRKELEKKKKKEAKKQARLDKKDQEPVETKVIIDEWGNAVEVPVEPEGGFVDADEDEDEAESDEETDPDTVR